MDDDYGGDISKFVVTGVCVVGGFATLLLVVALIKKWIYRPEWRTPQAFLTITDLTIGTFVIFTRPQLFAIAADLFGRDILFKAFIWIVAVFSNLMTFSICWSFCLPIVIYKQLLWINKPIKHPKAIATAFSFGIFIVVSLVRSEIISYASRNYISPGMEYLYLRILFVGVPFLSILLHVFVVLKVRFNEVLMKRDSEHTLTLVKIALMTQIVTLAFGLAEAYMYITYWRRYVQDALEIMTSMRLLPMAAAVLRSKATVNSIAPAQGVDLKTFP